MGLLRRLFSSRPEKPKVSELPDTAEGLRSSLASREDWDKVSTAVIESIFTNASGDVSAVKGFIYVSELHNLVKRNFIGIARNEDLRTALSLFAVTLHRLGLLATKQYNSLRRGFERLADEPDEVHIALGTIDLAHRGAILCDPFHLPSYIEQAYICFSFREWDGARQWCSRYREAERRLLDVSESALTSYDTVLREDIPTFRQQIADLEDAIQKARQA